MRIYFHEVKKNLPIFEQNESNDEHKIIKFNPMAVICELKLMQINGINGGTACPFGNAEALPRGSFLFLFEIQLQNLAISKMIHQMKLECMGIP